MTEDPRIRDIPTVRKALQDITALKTVKGAIPLLRPVLRLLGVDTEKIDTALAKSEELERMAEELASLPDRFNELFSSRGWIVYDLMNVEVAKAAVNKAQAGDIDSAEADLVIYYSPETVKWKLQTMMGVRAFHPRMPLAQKALIDYQEGRYHACIPVILALLDGMVSELHQQRLGFFAEDVNLEAWDSVAAHNKGLNVLKGIFQKCRRKTTTAEITIPYRNGILHGMDLGYDNRTVAAKTWAALFAARDWAIKAERGLLKPPPPETPPTWGDTFRKIRELSDDKIRLKEWEPRVIRLGQEIPQSGSPEAFDHGTPERKLSEYLSYWKARNYGFMAQCLSTILGYDTKEAPARVR